MDRQIHRAADDGAHDLPFECWVSVHPWRMALVVLGVVFILEAGIMIILPEGLSRRFGRWPVAAVDALLLSALLVPCLWWVIVAPAHRMANCRQQLFDWALNAEERKARQMSRDLHDGLGQLVTALDLELASLEAGTAEPVVIQQVQRLREIDRQLHEGIRQLSRGLRPQILDDRGLAAAIQLFADEMSEAGAAQVCAHVAEIEELRMPEPVETALFRIVQEAVMNAVRHASPRQVDIEIGASDGEITLSVSDDGSGFLVKDAFECRNGAERPFGLICIRERAQLLGGTARVWSRPGQGTRVDVRLPLSDERLSQ